MPGSSITNTYRNPILPGFNPDPSICYAPGLGYFVSTSTFEYFPGLPIYHSKDLITWKVSGRELCMNLSADGQLIGHAINRRSQGVDMRTVESSAGLWAPTFRYHKGRWYMICSCFWRLRISEVGPASLQTSGRSNGSLDPTSYPAAFMSALTISLMIPGGRTLSTLRRLASIRT
jgi:beta-xylosidase